jgi:hypothetical protein
VVGTGEAGTTWWARLIPKQGTGIVGRLSTVAMVMLVMMGLGIYGIDGTKELGIWLKFVGVLLLAGTGLAFVYLLLRYAERQPLYASLEGGELVQAQLKQWEIAAKDSAPAMPTANVEAPPPPEPKPEGPKE